MKPQHKNLIKNYNVTKEKLSRLQPRYFGIFEYWVGITDGTYHTFKESGEHFGVSPERIRQITKRVEYEVECLTN